MSDEHSLTVHCSAYRESVGSIKGVHGLDIAPEDGCPRIGLAYRGDGVYVLFSGTYGNAIVKVKSTNSEIRFRLEKVPAGGAS